jgi:hypothetical protein
MFTDVFGPDFGKASGTFVGEPQMKLKAVRLFHALYSS